MVRCTEWALRNQRGIPSQFSGNGMDLRRLQTLSQRQGRKNRRKPLCHHRLARSRRANHDKIVSSSGSHFHCPFGTLLPSDIGKVGIKLALVFIELFACIYVDGLKLPLTRQKADNIHQRLHPIDFQIVHHSRLTHILNGNYQPLELLCTGTDGDGQCSLYWLEMTVKAQFSHHHVAFQVFTLHATTDCQQGDSKRKVERAAFFPQVGRRHIHRNIPMRELITILLQSGSNTVTPFTDSRISQSREAIHHPDIHAYFYRHGCNVQSVYSSTVCFYEHNINPLTKIIPPQS